MGLGVTPTMPSTGGYDVTILKQDQLDANISAIMPLIAPAAYPALDAVKKGYGSSEANYEASEDTVLYSVAQTFYAAAVADEVLVVRAVGDQRGAGDAGQRADPLRRRHRHQGRRRPRRAGAGARQAGRARRPLRARAVVPRARHADPGRRAVQGGAARDAAAARRDRSRHGAAPAPRVPRPHPLGGVLRRPAPRLRAGSGPPRCRRSPRRTSATTSASPATTTPGRSARSSTGRSSTAAPGTRSATWRPRRRRRPRRRPPC